MTDANMECLGKGFSERMCAEAPKEIVFRERVYRQTGDAWNHYGTHVVKYRAHSVDAAVWADRNGTPIVY